MRLDDLILPAALTLGGLWLLKTYAIDPAGELGKLFAQNVVMPARTAALYPGTAARGVLEGFGVPDVPVTPTGYRPSNWSWDLTPVIGIPTILGLPEGWTPGQFCAASPGSPICQELKNRGAI